MHENWNQPMGFKYVENVIYHPKGNGPIEMEDDRNEPIRMHVGELVQFAYKNTRPSKAEKLGSWEGSLFQNWRTFLYQKQKIDKFFRI